MATIRRPGAASATVLIGLTVSLVAANLIAPEWARRAGLDVWNYAALESERHSLAEERTEMDAKAERDARRRGQADQLALRLVARDATLEAVALEIMELFDEPVFRSTLEAHNPTVRDPRLVYARHTIHRVLRQLDHDPALRGAVRARLEADYRALEATWASAPAR